MERIPLLLLAFIILTVAVNVAASPEESPRPSLASLDKRLERCVHGGRACTDREDLQILEELTDSMSGDLQRIDKDCEKISYKNCFNPVADDVAAWHKAHDEMSDMAKLLEQRYITTGPAVTGKQLNLLEPAAGPAPTPNPYTNPDQEQLHDYKRDWWQGEGWAPEEEANPYHKW